MSTPWPLQRPRPAQGCGRPSALGGKANGASSGMYVASSPGPSSTTTTGDACHGVPRQTSRCTMTSPGSQPIDRRLVAPARGTLSLPMSETHVREAAVEESDAGGAPELSVVVTLFQEGATLEELQQRLTTTLTAFGRSYEVLYVDDGSTDGTFASLERIHDGDPHVRAVRLKRNVGQHPAMHAGLSRARGRIVVTMDGDLQNPPEDVPRLVEAVEAGYDVASGRRGARHDSLGRTLPSRLINGMLRRFTGVDISDFGCAFNAYRRDAVEPMLGAIGRQKFTKALVLSGGATVVEVDVGHAPRQGTSSYTPLRLTRLALHVLAGFWPQPIQTAGIVLGTLCTLASAALGIYGLGYWISNGDFPGPLLLGALVVAVLGVQGFILALVGEHLGRIQRVVEHRPLYLVDREL